MSTQIMNIFRPVALFIGLLIFQTSSAEAKTELFQQVFESSVYDTYFAQLRPFVTNQIDQSPVLKEALIAPLPAASFEKSGISFIQFMQSEVDPSPANKKAFHRRMMLSLRSLLRLREIPPVSDTPLSHEISHFLDSLCTWIFTSPVLYEAVQDFFISDLNLPINVKEASKLSLDQFIQKLHEAILKKIDKRELAPELENAYVDGDLPFILFFLDNAKKTRVMRMANTARDTALSGKKTRSAQINDEFLSYLTTLRDKGGSHLYINFMKRRGAEGYKTLLIENLETHKEITPSLYVVTLNRNSDSPFYLQANEFKNVNQAALFKSLFLDQFFNSDDYYWSQLLDRSVWKTKCETIITNVHAEYFRNQPLLTQQERLDFIELSYIKLAEELIAFIQPDTVNMTCKQSVDRGPSFFALYYLYEMNKQGKKNNVQVATFLLAPAILYRNRPIQKERVQRFQSAAARLLSSVTS